MIVITGASDGLGLQVAKLYKEAGKKVVNISRNESRYADINICLSLREGPEIEEAAKKVLEIDEPLEILINCAGVFSQEELGEVTEDEIKRLMSTNVKPAILLVSHMIERIKKDETDILNVASSVGTRGGYLGEAVYTTSKWAIRGFTKNLQAEFKGKPNRIISFCPGGFRSSFFKKATGKDFPEEGQTWMEAKDIALALKQTLDLPKNMEVSEIVINRKQPRNSHS
jgi:NADP-dependent 3-hydroxy acid dehydrogenase YdfG